MPQILPILSLDEGKFNGLALKIEGSQAVMILSGHTRPGLDAILESRDGEDTLTPFALQIDGPYESKIDCDWSYTETALSGDASAQQAMIDSNQGWALLAFSDNKGTELPTLKTYPISITDQQRKRLKLLTTMIYLEATEWIKGGLLLKDNQVVGVAERDPSSVIPQATSGKGTRDVHGKTLGFNVYPIRYLETEERPKVSDLASHLHRVFGDGNWVEGPPTADAPIKMFQVESQKINLDSFVKFRFHVKVQGVAEGISFAANFEEDGNVSGLIELDTLFGGGRTSELSLVTADRTISGKVVNSEVATRSGPRRIDALGTLPNSTGRFGKQSYPADRILNVSHAVDELSGSTIADWNEVTAFEIKSKIRQDELDIRLEFETEPGSWRDVFRESFAFQPEDDSSQVASETTASVLEFESYEIELSIDAKEIRLSGDKRFWVHLDKDSRIYVRDSSSLKQVASIDTSSEPDAARTLRIDQHYLYIFDKNGQRVLCYELASGQFKKALQLSDFGLSEEFAIIGMAASPHAFGECVIAAKHRRENRHRLVQSDTVSNRVLFSRDFNGFGIHNWSDSEMSSPYWISFNGSRAFSLFESSEDELYEYEDRPYFPPLWDDRNVSYRKQRIERALLPPIGEEHPLGGTGVHRGTLTKSVGTSPQVHSTGNYLYVDEPVHFIREPGSKLEKVIPVWSNNPPVALEIIVGPDDYSLSEAQRLQIDANAKARLSPDFILMRATDTLGKSSDFWVTVDRRRYHN
ncbi:MAG: hypothetical protein ACSHYA_16550 [Opitutaceae bacterium]